MQSSGEKTFVPSDIVDFALASFDSLTLQTGDLNGCIPIGTFLARWGSPELLFQEDNSKNRSKSEDNFELPKTGAPLRDLETAFPSLDASVIGLVYVQCGRDIQKTAKALHTMLGSSDSREDSEESAQKLDSQYTDNILVNAVFQFLLQSPQERPLCMEKESFDASLPRYALMWRFLKKKYDVISLAGNQDIADTVFGVSEAFLIFVTGLYLQIKDQNDEEFFTVQKPFRLIELSEIVVWLQSLMARLSEKERYTRFQGEDQNIVELVLQLACLRLFGHLYNRHKKRSWIRNTSSIDSDILAALDVDRKLMQEQDQAFSDALTEDQRNISASIVEKDSGEDQLEEVSQEEGASTAKTMSREDIRAARLAALEKRLKR